MSQAGGREVAPPYGIEPRRRWARRILHLILTAPHLVTVEDRDALVRYLEYASRGGEGKPLRLREAIGQRGYTTTTFAKAVGVAPRTVRCWLDGTRSPSREAAMSMARVLGLSPIRVLPNFATRQHFSTAKALAPTYDPSAPLLGQNLRAARLSLNVTQRALAAECDTTSKIVSRCERGDVDSMVIGRLQDALTRRLRAAASPARRRGRPRKIVTP